ncbi:MAG TPA: hypothetical protein VGS08_05945 [Candidatus Saccharimonadales bacterium]|nr:hypothetical protein [Candidatus Saccharimonadales bacterium]
MKKAAGYIGASTDVMMFNDKGEESIIPCPYGDGCFAKMSAD